MARKDEIVSQCFICAVTAPLVPTISFLECYMLPTDCQIPIRRGQYTSPAYMTSLSCFKLLADSDDNNDIEDGSLPEETYGSLVRFL